MTAHASISRFADQRVLVIGDVMLDHFQIGRVDRISPEAPVPVVKFDREEFRPGGAANVARNVAALGGRTALIGVAGDDDGARELCRQLRLAGIDDQGLIRDRARPTTRKTRIVTERNQQVARLDHESDADVGGPTLAAVLQHIERAGASARAIVLSDYRKGVVTPAVIAGAIRAAAAARVPLLIDPKIAQAARYRGAALITPNHHEAERMTQMAIRTPAEAARAARTLHAETGASVVITWGEHGMWVFDGSAEPSIETALPAVAREVADVTGAGDTVIAVIALALAAGATLVEAARLANIAAGLVVARFGPASVTAAELSAAIPAIR
jgi:rfaE bifunctional protein kinase chain/domain